MRHLESLFFIFYGWRDATRVENSRLGAVQDI
ncbi:oxidoreductase [Pseudomonas sp. 57B-090624]|nr:oxidoreductase [Pseudomonas sp. 57B-090624]